MTRRYPGLHDPNVTTAEYADRVDTDRDYYPSRSELADDGTTWSTGPLHEPCGDAECLLCALRESAKRWAG